MVVVDCGRPEVVRSAQSFLAGLEDAGIILCVSGRAGSDELPGIPVAAARLNDEAQPKNLKELAEELGLEPREFVFLSAAPAACEEVRGACPEVLVTQLPAGTEEVPQFLANFWALDRPPLRAPVATIALSSARLTEIAALSSVAAITRAIDSEKALRSRGRGIYTAPRTGLEEVLADLWARLLRVERLGIHDHFFAMGGHSLLAAQAVARVRQTLGVEMPLRALFDAPTIAEFASRIEAARRQKTGAVIPPLQTVSRDAALPLSYAQQRLWFIDQLEPGTSLYNTTAMFRMKGQLKLEPLQQTIDEIVRRHEALRSTFPTVDGKPVQAIAAELRVALPVTELSGIAAEQREQEAERVAREQANYPFDLAQGPLVRASLLRLAERDHILLIFVHHIVTDGWSMNVLADEVAALYGAFQLGRPSPLPELAIQYADFAVWQREWLDGAYQQEQVGYWKRQLAGAPALLELPTDRPRPAMQRHRGDTQILVLPQALVEKLSALGRGEGVTLYMTLLAAFQTLLSRYSSQQDIVVGSPIAGRNYAEIEPLIGFFVSTLALRVDLSGNPRFRDLLGRVKEVTLQAYAHQDVPFEKAVEELAPERSLSYNPIFQTVFALQNPLQNIEAAGLQIERTLLNAGASLFDISCFAVPVPEGLLLRAQYDTDLFDQATIVRMLDHFQQLLQAAVADPDQRIDDLPLLTAAEEQRLLVEWNDTAAAYPREACAHELFEEQAARVPGNLAVAFGSRSLTYGDLNRRANQLAHYLRGLGVGPESVVGILLNRSDEMVTAILGAVKAGAAYLPMDPAYPEERLAFMLEDAGAAVLLTSSELAPGAALTSAIVISLDTGWDPIAAHPGENPARVAHPRNLAYVIYTSGSTGRPKGVELEHRNLLNLVAWHQREYQVQPEDRATQIAAPAFDASVWEIWPYLTAGASLHIPDDEIRSSPQQLLQWLERERITLSFLPTPLAESVLDVLKETPTRLSLRAMLTGGDKLHQYPDAGLSFRLVNHYGPTENTVVATWTPVAPGGAGAPPIGKPIANTCVYILDPHMRPVPVGVPGELYIGGESLARGYRNHPELTADRFVHSSFAAGRLYRTGDRVRYLPDGNIEFLGRLDYQVKIRGFRIELGEIEAVLAQHPTVKECAVVAHQDGAGGPRLAAYVVARGEKAPTAALRALLEGQLPEYMVPAAFVFLDAFPLTANGKIDTRALPAPEHSAEDIAAYVPPRTPLEERLCAIWGEVLRLPQVGIRDNFFVCGGHSLLATQVVSRVRQSTGVELPLRFLFLSPTVEELASRMEKIQAERAGDLAPIPRLPRGNPLPVSFAQQRLWFLDQLDPNSALYNAPWAIRLKGELHADALRQALNDIVQRHEIFRTTFTVADGSPLQVIASEVDLELTRIDLGEVAAEEQEAEVRRLVLEDASRPFNLVTGPVFRAILMRLNSSDHALLLNSHHISNDGWSIWRFLKELGEAYQAACEGKPCPFEELPIQYADFASWQRNWLQGEVLDNQLAFWKHHLEGAPDTLELPTDKPRPAVLSYRGSVEKMAFPKSLADRLKALGRSEDATLYMTLLSAFQTMLFRYTGQEDIVVGSPIANRTRTDIEELIGFFVNTIVMRTDLSGNPTFRELLRRVRDFSLGAYSNQDVPFEKLVEMLRPDRYLGRVPLFQVWFALQNLPRTVFHLPGLELTSMDLHNSTSKFDLGLFVADKPDGMICSIEYSTDLFEPATIRRMLEQYGVLLEAIAEDWDRPIAKLPLLPAAEQERLLSEWNDPSRQFARETCIHQIFEQQAARTPDNIALVFEQQQWNYRELNRRSNQLAHRLRALGVGPETLVGICMERSLEMLVAVLGVLKAGGGYLPLDPAYPKDRRAFMLEDAAVPVLLTQAELLPEVPQHGGVTICLDIDWHTIENEAGDDLPNLTRPEDVAYVIYTSGSTGKPKGVIVTHANVARLFTSTDHWFGFGPNDVWTLFHSFAFDFSVWEIWGALL
ncbi:MAG TPA: amino acid adenylation domain-containing protein, partial [Candidatus Acidoferrum sp.]|nr:amino acid adenylation domain-containing protein [Candidatus Acidoferrum sp.]